MPNSGQQNPRARDFSLTRMSSLGTNGGGPAPQWTDSLPRRDFYSNIAPTGSLPRRDKAGLGRPEPPRPQSSLSVDHSNGYKPGNGASGNLRRRDLSLNRDNTSSFRSSDAFSGNKGKYNFPRIRFRILQSCNRYSDV